jgi:hypothetical protein
MIAAAGKLDGIDFVGNSKISSFCINPPPGVSFVSFVFFVVFYCLLTDRSVAARHLRTTLGAPAD